MYVHVRGARCLDDLMYGSVLFGRFEGRGRYSVVSELWLQHAPEWAMKDQIAEAGFLLPSSDQKIVAGKFRKFF